MRKKYSTRDFLYILCSCYKDVDIDNVSFAEIELIGKIMKGIPEFSMLNNLFDLDCSFEEFAEICSCCGEFDDERLYISPKFDYKKVLNDCDEYTINLFDNLLFAHEYLESIGDSEKCPCAFFFDSPDTNYEMNYYNGGLGIQEDILFTDGDIIDKEENDNKVKLSSHISRNVEVVNSSYSIILTKSGEYKALNIRSDYLSDGFIVHEVSNILNNRINHYKQMSDKKPKVYRLIKQ